MARRKTGSAANTSAEEAKVYKFPSSQTVMRPEIGTQSQFKKRKPPVTYRFDSSLSPTLEWDGKNPAREEGEKLINEILKSTELQDAKDAGWKLKNLSQPFLNWAGKGERLSFDVPTLPLFIHERLSTKAIIETLAGHTRDKQQELDLFADPKLPIGDRVLKAYEHKDKWVNRMLLGDSLVIMNSLLNYENLGGQVQMIYIDPPYGVRFGSNFQPFVRERDVAHGEDEHMTREPEMVQAYRDTWELGLHSYLTYLRDRLTLSRDLLTPSGSVFVQISDENLHHVREVMDEVFGAENFVNIITFRVKSPLGVKYLGRSSDFIVWYSKNKEQMKYRQLYVPKVASEQPEFNCVELSNGKRMSVTDAKKEFGEIPAGARYFTAQNLGSSGYTESCMYNFEVNGKKYYPPRGKSWKTNEEGMKTLLKKKRLVPLPNSLRFVYYVDDFPVQELSNMWTDTFAESDKLYVVQTATQAIQRCMLMTTDPGDLVIDPTCGSGTTAYVAEQWGRRWITMDVSRVPLALARQRLLTATYPWYQLRDDNLGPAGGFTFSRKQNKKGEEVGGIIPHVTLKSIANNEPAGEEILVDKPEVVNKITRVTGPFALEATIPSPIELGEEEDNAPPKDDVRSSQERMVEILRKSPIIRIDSKRSIKLKDIRLPTKTLSLSAEGTVVNGKDKPVAFVFGPDNGPVSERLVFEAAKEANAKNYAHLYVIGFAIEPNAIQFIEQCERAAGIGATYIAATPDLIMSDLLKTMRSSQIFSVCGLPECSIKKIKSKDKTDEPMYQVSLLGLDTFDPVSMTTKSIAGNDVPAWFLDTDYNGLCFHVTQAFFPRTAAWDNLKHALKSTHDESVWDHLAGATSAPFRKGETAQVAVKVVDDRGNELIRVISLSESEK